MGQETAIVGEARVEERQGSVSWRGGHHLALVTRDLDATVRFYQGVLGMPLRAALGPTPYHGRHCLFGAGTFLMHFFEQPDAQIFSLPVEQGQPQWAFVPGAYQHIALSLEDEASLLALRERLLAEGVAVTEPMNVGPLCMIVFPDNNGITIEANWSEVDMASIPVNYSDSEWFDDSDPLPAVREIMGGGERQG